MNELISTPNFDRLAAEGALFLNALVRLTSTCSLATHFMIQNLKSSCVEQVPAPSCTPCRSSLMSGQYFWQTGLGAILEGARWDETIPSFPLELEKSGYFIGHTYKVCVAGSLCKPLCCFARLSFFVTQTESGPPVLRSGAPGGPPTRRSEAPARSTSRRG